MTCGPRRYIPAKLETVEVDYHLACEKESCDNKLTGEVKAYDWEDYRDKVNELAERSGWSLDIDVLCRNCTLDKKVAINGR